MTSSISEMRSARRRSFSRSSPVECARPASALSAYDHNDSASSGRGLRSFIESVSHCGVYSKMAKADALADSNLYKQEATMERTGPSGSYRGLAVGGGIGMRLAPKSGQETREMLRSKAGEGAYFLKQRSTEFKQSATEWVDKGKD